MINLLRGSVTMAVIDLRPDWIIMEVLSAMAAAALAIVTSLGGVQVSVSGSQLATGIMPMEPTAETMDTTWPTNAVYPNQRILMTTGAWWIVKRSTVDAAGVHTIEIRPNSSTSQNLKVTVQPGDVATQIWQSGEPYVADPPEGGTETPVETPGSPEPIPSGPPDMPPPPAPIEP
jgi:hypothetical protein